MDEDLVFDYDETLSDERNFMRWFMMNCSERSEFGDQSLASRSTRRSKG